MEQLQWKAAASRPTGRVRRGAGALKRLLVEEASHSRSARTSMPCALRSLARGSSIDTMSFTSFTDMSLADLRLFRVSKISLQYAFASCKAQYAQRTQAGSQHAFAGGHW